MERPREDINWWPLYIVLLLICAGVAWWGMSRGGTALVAVILVLPAFGWVVARLFIRGAEKVAEAKNEADWAEWQGINYAYGPNHLRAADLDGTLWFYEADLCKALGVKGDSLTRMFPPAERQLLEGTKFHILSEAGVEHLLLKHPGPESKKLLMYMRREAYFPFKRARGEKPEIPVTH